MKTLTLLAAGAAACSSPAPVPSASAAATQPPINAAALTSWFDRELAPHAPAVVAAVVTADGIVWHGGAGSRDGRGGPPPDRTSVFRLGSITKVVTGIAAMQLRDRGLLDLDAPIAPLVPELPWLATSTPGVTLRHLFAHTSGIPSMGDGSAMYSPDTAPSEAALLRALGGPLAFPTGSRSEYSNAGVALAGMVVARATAQPYRAYVDAAVLAPLGMRTARWDRAAIPPDRRVAGRSPAGGIDPPSWQLGAFEPAGGLWASLDDVAELARFALGKNERVLGARSRSEMMADAPLPGAHGIVWVISNLGGQRVIWHNGSTTDYVAALFTVPDRGVAAIVLASGGAGDLIDCAAAALAVATAGGAAPRSCAKHVPRALAPSAVPEAIDGMLTFLAAPAERAATAVFAPSFLAQVPVSALIDGVRQMTTKLGACQRYTLGTVNGTSGEATLHCANGNLRFSFELEQDPPHRFTSALLAP